MSDTPPPIRQRPLDEQVAFLMDQVVKLLGELHEERTQRNRLARECADLRDEAATTRQQERERIASWFVAQGDLRRISNDTDEDHEYHRLADVIRDDIPGYPS